jgi:hypothetical protein
MPRRSKRGFLHRHALSLVALAILVTWIVLYTRSDPQKHPGAFFGNAIADWTGLVVMVLATKVFYESGSAESRPVPASAGHVGHVREFLRHHSLTIFLVLTGAGWLALFIAMDPMSRWGQVVGNILSEWTQLLGIVLLTKGLLEMHSKESKR